MKRKNPRLENELKAVSSCIQLIAVCSQRTVASLAYKKPMPTYNNGLLLCYMFDAATPLTIVNIEPHVLEILYNIFFCEMLILAYVSGTE